MFEVQLMQLGKDEEEVLFKFELYHSLKAPFKTMLLC